MTSWMTVFVQDEVYLDYVLFFIVYFFYFFLLVLLISYHTRDIPDSQNDIVILLIMITIWKQLNLIHAIQFKDDGTYIRTLVQ